MKKCILFVDDEPRVLEGLRRMLRSKRKEWDIHFACGGEEALAVIDEITINVVVSDMRMPGMDGAELLAIIMKKHPLIARLVLSGHADEDTIMKTVRRVHQYLSKPCDADTLINTIQRLCDLQDKMTNENLQEIIKQLPSIPSMPSLYRQIVSELEQDSPNLKYVGKIISQDVGMTAKILQLVNSSFFGLRRRVSNPAHAVNLLGLDTIVNLVLSVQVFSSFEDENLPSSSVSNLWAHSTRVGIFAKEVARAHGAGHQIVDDALGAGMMHDIGKLILMTNRPEDWVEIMKLVNTGETITAAEMAVIGTTHEALGGYLLGLWGMSSKVVEAVTMHHNPTGDATSGFSPLTAVHVGNAIDHELVQRAGKPEESRLSEKYLTQLGVADQIEKWRETCRVIHEQAEAETDTEAA
jgi:HD-like signal output (HDOD) protein